jgi:hypothetical protein
MREMLELISKEIIFLVGTGDEISLRGINEHLVARGRF